MSTQCSFELDSPNGIYYSGQVISGSIQLNTIKSKNVNNVKIVFVGEAKVRWSESSSTTNSDGSTSSSTTYYTAHNVYVHSETIVRGEGVLPIGMHVYTFNIALPVECPTSCEGKYGHIRYEISLIVDRPYRFNNVFKNPITVLQTVDLNLYPSFKIPIMAEEVGSLCCWSCSSAKLFYTLRIPFGAYAPGQLVKYSLQINNQTMVDTWSYSLEFSQKQTFIAHSPRRKERHKKNVLDYQLHDDVCLRLSTRIFEGEIRIPAVPPSTTEFNAIIKVEYQLKVIVQLSGCHSNTELKIPIFIGNVPIRESLIVAQTPQCLAGMEDGATAPQLDSSSDLDLPPNYKDLKPPSFEEAIRSDSPFVDMDVDERHDKPGFRPMYPMYS